MRRRLPPLNALRAFEAAARHQSFSQAARELGVAHSAVGRHVANLEGRLGLALFVREQHKLKLTAQGALYAEQLTVLFDQIQEVTASCVGVKADMTGYRELSLDYSGLVLEGAINGLGLAMAQRQYIKNELKHGRLLPLFDTTLKTGRSYYLA